MKEASAYRAGRAMGAMFFSVFGGAWLAMWAVGSYGQNLLPLALIALVSFAMLMAAIYIYRTNRSALAQQAATPERKRANKIFHLVNAGQWVLILIISNVLINLDMREWIIPAAMFIIGLHFLPLASSFKYFPHFVSGLALMLWAVAYSFLMTGGPTNPIGCLGAGLVLWASAAYGLTKTPEPVAA